FGEYRTGGVAELVAAHIQRELGWEARATVLGYLQRSGRPVAFDRIFALRLGARAANLCLSGGYGRMAALQNGEIVDIPLAEAVASIRKLSDHFLNRYENFFAAEPDPTEPRA
ncbi:MAG: 6-phosphofructokinase, partial [Proteobacteria bacterium]|nr:6-phosphofructokinase [Pseudomonadota bacterium]